MPEITWTTLEFEERKKHRDWVWYAGLVTIVVAALAFYYGNIFFGIFTILAGFFVIFYSNRAPRELVVTLGEKGIVINEYTTPFSDIQQFWLDESGKQDKLLVLTKSMVLPLMVIPVEGVSAEDIRIFLKEYIKEEFLRESTGNKIFDYLGF